jgi:hypothetical protein
MHDHILRRIIESDEDSEKRDRLRKILKELQQLTDIEGVGAVARDIDDILNVPVAE